MSFSPHHCAGAKRGLILLWLSKSVNPNPQHGPLPLGCSGKVLTQSLKRSRIWKCWKKRLSTRPMTSLEVLSQMISNISSFVIPMVSAWRSGLRTGKRPELDWKKRLELDWKKDRNWTGKKTGLQSWSFIFKNQRLEKDWSLVPLNYPFKNG